MFVKENLIKIKNNLPANVKLIAVSKKQPHAVIKEAYNFGHLDFGENYVQELVDKQLILPKDIRWHFIGHLQSNKVKYIAPFVHLIHGVDSVSLLLEINKQAKKNNRVINCLLQIHIAQELTKFGFSIDDCFDLFESNLLLKLENVKIIGFMAMASNTDDKMQIKKEFQSLNIFSKKTQIYNQNDFCLSMGMSEDYNLAIEEGSNMVRIGSLIFGQRQ